MNSKLRPSGIEGLGDMSWGTHFCLFYETKEDLLDFFMPFFKAGLEHQEFCWCVTSEPLIAEEAEQAMRDAFPDFERYLAEGQIEITPHTDWYLKNGHFDEQRVLQGWIDKLDKALAKGFLGVRFAANILLDKRDWESFARFEGKLEETLHNLQIEGLCAYNLNRYSAANVLDVMRHHQFTLARRGGVWEPLEGAKLQRAHEEVLRLNAELEQRVIERTEELVSVNERLRAEIIEHEQTEEELRRNEYRLQAAIDAADIVLWERDLPSGRLTWLGHSEKVFGLAPGEFDGTLASFEKLVHPEDIEELRRKRQRALEERSEYSHEYRVVWRDGSIHWIRAQGRFIYNEAGQPVRLYGAVLDITERKRAEEEVNRQKEIFQKIFDNAPLAITFLDQDGRLLLVNRAWEQMFGWTLKELNERDLDPFITVLPDPQERQRVYDFMAAGSGQWDEFKATTRDGRTINVWTAAVHLSDGTSIGLAQDITERKRAEEALRKSERVLREAESLGHTGSWEQDLVTGEIFNTEENLHLFFGDDRSKGANLEDYAQAVHPDDREYVLQRRAELLEEEGPGDIEYRVVWPDGSVHVIFGRATVVRDELNRLIRVYGTNVDITERKQAEESLRTSERVLREAESLGQTGSWEQDLVTGETFNSEANLRLFFGDDHSKGASFEDFVQAMHPDDREYVVQRRAQLIAEGRPGETEFRVVWPDGTIHVIHRRATVVCDESGKAIRLYGTNVDITERKQAEEEIRRYAARMETLAEISHTFVEAGLDYQSVLDAVAWRTAELIGDACVMTLFSQDNQRAHPVAFHHPNPESRALMHDALLHTWQGGTNTERFRSLLAGESLYVPLVDQEAYRAATEPEFWPFVDQVGISSSLIVPLQVRGRVIGTLGLTRDRYGSPYTTDDQVLLQDIADRAALTIQNVKLFEQVEGARERLEALSRRLLEVQEAERRALTTELHDRVGQNLTGLSINLQNLKASLSSEEAQAFAAKFNDAQALVEDTSRQIRDIMAELHLPELEDYGLAAALETYAERAASRGNLELIANLPDLDPPRLSSNVRVALFRAAQEAISNVLKHADATRLEVSLEGRNGRVRLKIEDNGRGFEPDIVSQKEGQTWGLQIMRERIESIGGKIQIESKPGQGTRVLLDIERPS